MLDRLRSGTEADHADLEVSLDLLSPSLSLVRFIQVLQGFHAFHCGWEPQVATLVDDEAFFAPRRRLQRLEQDLARLGAGPDPSLTFNLKFLSDRSAAWGSLYVMEGSTLGGQLISKALRRTDWAPEGGFAYFNSHGRDTAAMWRIFCEALETVAPTLDAACVLAGARSSFKTLREGLAPRLEIAA